MAMKYVEFSGIEGSEEKRHFIIFPDDFQHTTIVRVADEYSSRINDAVSAGFIRLSKDGYVTYGSSFGLRTDSNTEFGKTITERMFTEGCDYFVVPRERYIVVSKGFLDCSPDSIPKGALSVRTGSREGLNVFYDVDIVSSTGNNTLKRHEKSSIVQALEKVVNAGNLEV